VVIFLPVFSLALIALYVFESLREKYSLIVQAGLGIAFVSTFIAKESGEALSLRVGTPIKHADLGEKLVPLAFALFVFSVIWFYLLRNPKKVDVNITKIVGIVAVLLAAASIVMTYLVGHSGAEATWKERITPKEIVKETTNEQSMSETDAAITLSATEVSKHDNQNDCWTIIDNEVYDLTSYINSHPGGAPNILNLCGIDGSSSFSAQHGNERKPAQELSGFVIGAIGDTLNATTPSQTNSQPAPTKTVSPKPTVSTNLTGPITLSATEVAKHNSSNDCWSIVNNQVYNLTSYINSHPGGAANINNMCGKDASSAFSNQHGSQGKPNNVLSGFVLGALGQTINSIPTVVTPPTSNNQEFEEANEENEENEGDED
jgi:cytochrome b involved in lipid metabolism